MACPKCGSENITYHREQSGNVGLRQNTVIIKEQEKGHSCMYWICIGWWYKPIYWLLIGWWYKPLFGRRNKGGFNLNAEKTLNHTIAVCQNCGNSWKVK